MWPPTWRIWARLDKEARVTHWLVTVMGLGGFEGIMQGSLMGRLEGRVAPGASSPGRFPYYFSAGKEFVHIWPLLQRGPRTLALPCGAGQGAVGSISSSVSRPCPQPCGQAGLSAGWEPAGMCGKSPCGVTGLTGVAIVEFVVKVAGAVPGLLVLDPVGVGVGVVAHEHAEEDHHEHLQQQAGERQAPAEVGVPGHGPAPRFARSEAGQAYKAGAGAGRGGAAVTDG